MSRISNTQQKVNQQQYAERWDAIFGRDAVAAYAGLGKTQFGDDKPQFGNCPVCGGEMVESHGGRVCSKLLEQQGMDE